MIERAKLLQVIQATGWNVTRAAALLGMSWGALTYHLQRYGIQRPGSSLREAEEHTPALVAASRLQELRSRAVLIRDSQRIPPLEKARLRRVLAGELAQASARYRALVEVEL